MLAIQNTDVSIPLYINDMKEDGNQTIRTIFNVNDDVKNISFRHLPRLEDNKIKKENALTKAKYAWELPISELLDGSSDDAKTDNETITTKEEGEPEQKDTSKEESLPDQKKEEESTGQPDTIFQG